MSTVVIQIGNSDDKLTQQEWSEFVSDVQDLLITEYNSQIHFHGVSVGSAPWQNACWVIDASKEWIGEPAIVTMLRDELAALAKKYRQDNIAMTVGETEFVEAKS